MYSDPNGNSAEWLANVGRFIGGLRIGAIGLTALGITVIGCGPLCLIQPFSALVQIELSTIMYGGFMMASSWDDSIKNDMDAAKKANVDFIHAKYGFGKSLKSDLYINDIKDLKKIL